jgi:hypothetical protein
VDFVPATCGLGGYASLGDGSEQTTKHREVDRFVGHDCDRATSREPDGCQYGIACPGSQIEPRLDARRVRWV